MKPIDHFVSLQSRIEESKEAAKHFVRTCRKLNTRLQHLRGCSNEKMEPVLEAIEKEFRALQYTTYVFRQ